MSKLSGGEYLNHLFNSDVRLGTLLQKIINGVNQLGQASGVDAVGETSAPTGPNGVAVKASGEMVHIAVTDNSSLQRGTKYFTEYANEPNFLQPWVVDHGASRNTQLTLPTKTDGGTSTHSWYFRSYSQLPGSQPSAPVTYGGAASPTAITLTGSTEMTLIPSNGSGTASPNGSQGAQGLGKQFTRAAQGPKRQVS
jgi:hypothetical protein